MTKPSVRRRRGARPAFLLALAALVASAAGAADWKGQIVDQDGVPHVKNPAKGMEGPTAVDLKELWRLGGDTDAEDEFFGLIGRITMDADGNIYVLDSQLSEVKIYASDGTYLRTIGREGEGPGEFRRPGDMFLLPDGNVGVMQTVPGKIVVLTPEGDPAGEFPVPQPEGGGFQILQGGQLVGQNVVLVRQTQAFDQAKGLVNLEFAMVLVDKEGKELATLEHKTVELNLNTGEVNEPMFDTFERRWTVGDDGRVYACPAFQDYQIDVWAPDGTLERVIEREYTPYERTDEEIERVRSIWSTFTQRIPNAKLDISKTDKNIQSVYARDDGSLWVLTSRGVRERPDGALGVFDVYDHDGRFVRQVTLKGQGDPLEDAYFFDGGRLYVVTGFLNAALAAQGGGSEEEAEEAEDVTPMEIICYQVDVPILARGK